MRWPDEWKDPSRLELLKGTPINCLVGESPPPFPLGEIEFLPLRDGAPPEGVTLREGVWPDVQSARERRQDTAESGPTGAPWVNSNAWVYRLAQALEPDKTVWLTYPPPAKSEVVPMDSFPRPVAEAGAYGGQWVIDLHESLRLGLERGDDAAVKAWRDIVALLEFARKHREWRSWEPVAVLAVVSDFQGENELLSREFLNLAPRRDLAYRIVEKSRVPETSFEKYKAALVIDVAPPEGELREKLLAFAAGGGLLIWPPRPAGTAPAESKLGYDIYRHGKGRIAVPKEPWFDPYLLVGEVHLLLSHRQDVVRIWNGGTMNSHYVASHDGKRGVVHLVNYSDRQRLETVTLGFADDYRSARVFSADGTTTVGTVRRRLGTEVPVPPFSLYTAVELEG